MTRDITKEEQSYLMTVMKADHQRKTDALVAELKYERNRYRTLIKGLSDKE